MIRFKLLTFSFRSWPSGSACLAFWLRLFGLLTIIAANSAFVLPFGPFAAANGFLRPNNLSVMITGELPHKIFFGFLSNVFNVTLKIFVCFYVGPCFVFQVWWASSFFRESFQ